MRVTIELDTHDITDHDRRVLAALVSDDTTPLVLPIPGAGVEHTPAPAPAAGIPSPTPAPQGFMQRLGEATAQFGRSPGAAHEARLPVAQQAGVSTRSTMPEDDDAVDAGAELEVDMVERMAGAELRPAAQRGDADALVPDPAGPTQTEGPVLHIDPPPAHASRDRVRQAILGTVDAPVRHTTP